MLGSYFASRIHKFGTDFRILLIMYMVNAICFFLMLQEKQNILWSGKLKLDTEGVISGHGMYNRGNTICIPGQHKPRSEQEVYHEIHKPRTGGHRPADL